jgi:hypothetical protein
LFSLDDTEQGGDAMEPNDQLRVTVRRDLESPEQFALEQVVVKNGPQVYKVAVVRTFGDPDTGEVKKREFRVQSYRRKRDEAGYDFEKTESTWYCENAEIDRVQSLLSQQLPTLSGVYRRVDDAIGDLLGRLEEGAVEASSIVVLVEAAASLPGVTEALADSTGVSILIDAVALQRHRSALDEVERVVLDGSSTEIVLQKRIEGNWWLFGGRYIDRAARRSVTVLDQLDIPLIRADGSLHVVELKKANVSDLVVRHRNHVIVGAPVHEAVSQAMNYLRSLDEQRAIILTELGIEARRSSALVVIGHPAFVASFSAEEISEALRTYNSHLARVEVVTYAELVDGARRALSLGRAAG